MGFAGVLQVAGTVLFALEWQYPVVSVGLVQVDRFDQMVDACLHVVPG